MGWSEIGILSAVSLVLAGCSVVGNRESPLPKDGPTLVEVYRAHIANEGRSGPKDQMPLRAADDEPMAQRRTDESPTKQRFARLPNPDLVMHVYPHLSRGKYPIPGYVTVFSMYETIEYAMPGETTSQSRGGCNGAQSCSSTR